HRQALARHGGGEAGRRRRRDRAPGAARGRVLRERGRAQCLRQRRFPRRRDGGWQRRGIAADVRSLRGVDRLSASKDAGHQPCGGGCARLPAGPRQRLHAALYRPQLLSHAIPRAAVPSDQRGQLPRHLALPFPGPACQVRIVTRVEAQKEKIMRSTHRSFGAGAGLIVTMLAASTLAGGPLPAMEGGDLAQGGPFATMHMLLQKTVLNINVATIDIRVDKGTQSRFTQLAGGKPYSSELEHQLALAAIDARHAVVEMKFKRDIPLNRWIGVVKDNLEQA